MTYQEAASLVSEHQHLIGQPMTRSRSTDPETTIAALLISPNKEKAEQLYLYWLYDETNDNERAISKLGKTYKRFMVLVIGENGDQIFPVELCDYLLLHQRSSVGISRAHAI